MTELELIVEHVECSIYRTSNVNLFIHYYAQLFKWLQNPVLFIYIMFIDILTYYI